MCSELLYPPLDSFAVYDMRQTVAVGVIKAVDKKAARQLELARSPSLPRKLRRLNQYYPHIYIYVIFKRERERETMSRGVEGEAGSRLSREPNMGLDRRTLRS